MSRGRWKRTSDSAAGKEHTPRQLLYEAVAARYYVRLHYLDAPGMEAHDSFFMEWMLPGASGPKGGQPGIRGEQYTVNPDDTYDNFFKRVARLEQSGEVVRLSSGPGLGRPGAQTIAHRPSHLRFPHKKK